LIENFCFVPSVQSNFAISAYCIDYRCGVLEKPDPQEEGDDDLEEVDETEQANIPTVSGDTNGSESEGGYSK
jgi:hypothetical protein